ncbi:MAG: serine/threonine protein kinase [Deltaproteobacteria bacterium]|nr:serine/threonine protein kinase [Deltaproteobacteria bacterium]
MQSLSPTLVDRRADERIGTTLLGKWTLEAVLGSGGMATVYRARHALGRVAAVKLMHGELADDPEVGRRFAFEARAANRLAHPGAVAILDSEVSEDGLPFIVMELLEGVTLGGRVAAGPPLEPAELLRIVDDVLDVLVAAHAEGIIHRDVKPANVFLTSDGRVKLLDFGIAKAVSVERSIQTMPGSALGTLGYMAPEQVRGQADAKSDLFSVGATMFRVLAGRPVHPGKNLVEALKRVATEPAPSLAAVVEGVTDDVAAVVDLALAFDAAKRYPDAATMQRDVHALRRGEPPPFARARHDEVGDEATRRVSIVDERSSERSLAERLVGTRLQGGLVLTRLLGRGGMGAVYESRTGEGTLCAVKVILHHGDAEDSQIEERFRREASLAARIEHPNVVRTLAADVDRRAGHPFFVMELLDGRDLASWVRELGPIESTAVVRLFLQASRGVAAAHAIGIIHRDLKPANLFLAGSGDELVAKICDFGLAKSVLSEGTDSTHSLTKSGGALLGTPQYTAPEQAMQAKTADHRADVWGLAISMYEALSGRKPWAKCETLAQLLLAICTESVPRLEETAPWVEPALAAVVHRGLERDRERRYASVEEFAHALEPFAGGEARLTRAMFVTASRVAAPRHAPQAVDSRHVLSSPSSPTGASLDALAASSARASGRLPWPLVAGVGLLAGGMLAGWLALWPRNAAAPPAPPSLANASPSAVEPHPAAVSASAAAPAASTETSASPVASSAAQPLTAAPLTAAPLTAAPLTAAPVARAAPGPLPVRPASSRAASSAPTTESTTPKPGIQFKQTW